MEKKEQDEIYANFVKTLIVVVLLALPAIWFVGQCLLSPKAASRTMQHIQQYDDHVNWQYR